LGSRVTFQGLGFKGIGLRFRGLGLRANNLELKIFDVRVEDLGCSRFKGLGFRVKGLGTVRGLGFRV
jgi:hypothetical protein